MRLGFTPRVNWRRTDAVTHTSTDMWATCVYIQTYMITYVVLRAYYPRVNYASL